MRASTDANDAKAAAKKSAENLAKEEADLKKWEIDIAG